MTWYPLFLINQCADVVVMSFWIFTTTPVSVYLFYTGCCRALPEPPRRQDRSSDTVLDIHDYAGFSMPFLHRLLPSAAKPPAAARTRHARPTRQHKVSSAKEPAPSSHLASRGRRKEPSRGRLARSPGKGRISRKGGVSNMFGGVFPRDYLFRVPWLGFHCFEGGFYRR